MQVQKMHGVSLIYSMKGVFKMTKNEQTATMYESIPAVAELNKVPGFNPLKLLRRIVSPESGEAVLQLDLPYKKLWFRLANPKGRIRLNALRITEQMAIYEAQIYLERTDENPIGSFTSSCTKEEAPGGQYIQAAQQAAMDEALSDAGFGIQFADVNMGTKGSRYGSRIPVNGAAVNKNGNISAGTGTVSAERVQPSAAPAGGMVKAFPAAAGKAETSSQEKPAQQSALPVQEKMTAADAGQGEKKQTDSGMAVHTVPQAKIPSESAAGNNHPIAGLPAGMQENSENLPVNPENRMGNLPVQPATEQKTEEKVQALASVGKTAEPAQGTAKMSSVMPAGTMKASAVVETVQADKAQSQTGGSRLPAGPQTEVQNTAQSAGAGELPVKTAEAESLPIQANTGTPAVETPENVLSASVKQNVDDDTRKAVQGMMALLGGQNVSPKAGTVSTGTAANVENAQTKAPVSDVQKLPVTGGAASTVQNLPVTEGKASTAQDLPVTESMAAEAQNLPASGNPVQKKAEVKYTSDMSVEEIISRMTFEEAGQVVVDAGVCKGQTLAEVAERRPPSLRFYVYGAYRGDNNILRAAARIMLDSLEAKKAG